MTKVLVEDWVLEMLWKDFPWGAAKGELSEGEMREHIRRWKRNASESQCAAHTEAVGGSRVSTPGKMKEPHTENTMDQVEEKKKRAKLYKTTAYHSVDRYEEGDYVFLDESEFSPLYYARFKTEEHAWRAWYLWHSLMVF